MTPTRKEKTCKQCRKPFVPQRMGQVACSPLCALGLAQSKRANAEHTAKIRETKARKDAIKTRGQWVRETQIEFNKLIRARDRAAGHACISSGRPLDWTGNNVDAGHYRSVGSAPHLRFDERNCHAQSKKDNRYGSGCAVDYRIGLIARIGLEAVEALEADQAPRKHTIDDLREMKAEFSRRRREIEKAREAA